MSYLVNFPVRHNHLEVSRPPWTTMHIFAQSQRRKRSFNCAHCFDFLIIIFTVKKIERWTRINVIFAGEKIEISNWVWKWENSKRSKWVCYKINFFMEWTFWYIPGLHKTSVRFLLHESLYFSNIYAYAYMHWHAHISCSIWRGSCNFKLTQALKCI